MIHFPSNTRKRLRSAYPCRRHPRRLPHHRLCCMHDSHVLHGHVRRRCRLGHSRDISCSRSGCRRAVQEVRSHHGHTRAERVLHGWPVSVSPPLMVAPGVSVTATVTVVVAVLAPAARCSVAGKESCPCSISAAPPSQRRGSLGLPSLSERDEVRE